MSFSSDLSQNYNLLPISVDFPEDQQVFLNELSLLYKRIANSVNSKEAALYSLQEVATGQRIFKAADPLSYRNVYRMTINFGSLPNSATKTAAHGITFTDQFMITRLYGAASNPTGNNYLSLPFATPTALNQNISLSLDITNVIITTGIDYSAYTKTIVVVEYVKEL